MKLHDYLHETPNFVKAVVCFLRKEDKILLGLRKKVSNGLGLHIIAGIGGKLEPGETNDQALEREVQEEIMVEVKEFSQVGRNRIIVPGKPEWCQDIAIYQVNSWEKEPQETEKIAPKWYNENKLPVEQMWQDNIIWLPEMLKGKIIDGIYLFNEQWELEDYQIA